VQCNDAPDSKPPKGLVNRSVRIAVNNQYVIDTIEYVVISTKTLPNCFHLLVYSNYTCSWREDLQYREIVLEGGHVQFYSIILRGPCMYAHIIRKKRTCSSLSHMPRHNDAQEGASPSSSHCLTSYTCTSVQYFHCWPMD